MDFSTDTLAWNAVTHKWDLALEQISANTNNWGIPNHPYVYRVFISLDMFSGSALLLNLNNAATTAARELLIHNTILAEAKFVRVTERADTKDIKTLAELSTLVDGYIDPDFYASFNYDFVLTVGNSAGNIVSHAASLGLSALSPYALREDDTSHMPLSGWYSFRHSALQSSFPDYDAAKKTRDSAEYVLNWYTAAGEKDSFLPLSAGVVSVTPARTFLPGSSTVSNLLAGDMIRISVSGGSEEHTVTGSVDLIQVSKYVWRVGVSATQALTLTVTDANSNITAVTITLNTKVPGA